MSQSRPFRPPDSGGPKRRKRGGILRLVFGWILTVFGLVLALPLVPGPGFVFLLAGLALLSSESKAVRKFLRRLREWRLVRRAMREAERAGVKLELDDDDEEPDDSRGAQSGG